MKNSFINQEVNELHQIIKSYSFATLVSPDAAIPHITHLPLVLESNEGKYGALYGHVAKNNPHLDKLITEKKVLCIFHGPHAYISPVWYKTYPRVPTWSYVVVHVQGEIEVVNEDDLSSILSKMILYYDNLADYVIPSDYQDRLKKYIVGLKIKITHIIGHFKLNQHLSDEDSASVVQALQQQESPQASSLANLIIKDVRKNT